MIKIFKQSEFVSNLFLSVWFILFGLRYGAPFLIDRFGEIIILYISPILIVLALFFTIFNLYAKIKTKGVDKLTYLNIFFVVSVFIADFDKFVHWYYLIIK